MTLANKITIGRILLIPVFVLLAVAYGHTVAAGRPDPALRFGAVFVFLVAAASDGLDGYVARRYHQRSRLGAVLDPIADKGLLLSALVTLACSDWEYRFPVWFPVLVVTRDAVILAGSAALHGVRGEVQVRPSWLGKTATVCQMVAIAWIMLHLPFLGSPRPAVSVAGLFTLLSGVGYVFDGVRQLRAAGPAGRPESAALPADRVPGDAATTAAPGLRSSLTASRHDEDARPSL